MRKGVDAEESESDRDQPIWTMITVQASEFEQFAASYGLILKISGRCAKSPNNGGACSGLLQSGTLTLRLSR